MNPASVKCSGCAERIRSSYMVLFVAVVIFLALMAGIFSVPLQGESAGITKLALLGVLGLIFEYGYFFMLNKKMIKSNLGD